MVWSLANDAGDGGARRSSWRAGASESVRINIARSPAGWEPARGSGVRGGGQLDPRLMGALAEPCSGPDGRGVPRRPQQGGAASRYAVSLRPHGVCSNASRAHRPERWQAALGCVRSPLQRGTP